ncbi:hypothetical protein PLESTM_000101200 [Pleodorina starrii]|nr:hypothetical protein PLESTM_000101200 [Pleodorina starrii]
MIPQYGPTTSPPPGFAQLFNGPRSQAGITPGVSPAHHTYGGGQLPLGGGAAPSQGVPLQQQHQVPPAPVADTTAMLLHLQQQIGTLTAHVANQGGADAAVLQSLRNLGNPRNQQSPPDARFPFPSWLMARLPERQIDVSNMVLHNYQAFPEWQRLEQAQRGHADRAGSLLYELGIMISLLAIADLMAAGVGVLLSAAPYALNANWAGATLGAFHTLNYDVGWMKAIISARINCLVEFSQRGRDGLVALHHRYFSSAERSLADEITRDFDEQFAVTKQRISLKAIAEKEFKNRNGNVGPFQNNTGGHGRRGRGSGNGGRGFQQNRAATAAAASGASGPRQSS